MGRATEVQSTHLDITLCFLAKIEMSTLTRIVIARAPPIISHRTLKSFITFVKVEFYTKFRELVPIKIVIKLP